MLKIESDAAHNSIQMDADFSEYTKGDFIAGAMALPQRSASEMV